MDLSRAMKLLDRFASAAAKYELPAVLLVAVASRESRCGAALTPEGWDSKWQAFGIMQVDKRYHEVKGAHDRASAEHIEQAAAILADCLDAVCRKHPDWGDEHLLQGALVAYNAGTAAVQTIERMDEGTTGDNYGSDVIARAHYYHNFIGRGE